jgi:DsbC/DsbD-like thiol-disulfide interchange protein
MTQTSLSRRALLSLSAAALLPRQAIATGQPYSVTFLQAGFDGAAYGGGLMVTMAKGWKTYWRVPGAGGIPPSIDASGSNLKAFSFDCPLPTRFTGLEGETIGYAAEVLFPFAVIPMDAAAPVEVTAKAFLGICETICIPVQAMQQLLFRPVATLSESDPTLFAWRQRVPQATTQGPVTRAEATAVDGKIVLLLTVNKPLRDIFVEGNPMHYFNAPAWSADGLQARLIVNGAKEVESLRQSPLRLTLDAQGVGLEQQVTVV